MVDRIDEKYYEVIPPHSLSERVMARARDRMYDDFLRVCCPQPSETILDVGVSDVTDRAANVLERRYPYPEKLTAAGLGSGEGFRAAYPGIEYAQVVAGRALPFHAAQFDIATSNAVLEHVGGPEAQRRFVAELLRVGRRVFLTVPNRYFPVEHHTSIPFLHWTDVSFSWACRIFGKQDWSRAENLVLISRKRLRAACPPEVEMRTGVTGLPLGPLSSNLYLYARGAAT
jgi:SAM-dependent methyltransferase